MKLYIKVLQNNNYVCMFRTLSSSFGYDVTNNINLIASIMQLNFTIDANYSLEYGNIHTKDTPNIHKRSQKKRLLFFATTLK